MAGDIEEAKWSPLREDIELIEGASDRYGAPSWTLHDPIVGKFYKIGWLEFEMLTRWGYQNPQVIIQDIVHKTLLRPTIEDMQAFYQFLSTHSLLGGQPMHDTKRMMKIHEAKKNVPWYQYILKNYLFFRIPLWRPDKFLDQIEPIGNIIFTRRMRNVMWALLCVALFLVFRDLSAFLQSFQVLQTPSGIVGGLVALAFSKMFHEMGHGMLSKHYGCRVPTMGVAFIVLWPLLWTDTTDAWRLKSHKKRLSIDSGGMLFELSLAIIASILWAVLPSGALKDAMHMLAGVTWVMTLLVNLNPFMRFDGYYLLSDLTNIPNIQDRSFSLAKWWIRKTLWGMNTQKPETFSANKDIALILYAMGTWIYRFFLFLGIALIVYHFAFKALGVLLFVVEIWWFIIKPIKNEIVFWLENREKMHLMRHRKVIFSVIGAIALGIVSVPWKGYVTAPAIYKASQEIPLLAPYSAKIKDISVQNGQYVDIGDILFSFENAELTNKLTLSNVKLSTLEKDRKNKSLSSSTYRDASLIKEKIVQTVSELEVAKAEQALLTVKAPISGRLMDLSDDLIHSKWIKQKEILGLLISDKVQVEAFIKETDLAYLSVGAKAKFYSKAGEQKTLVANVTRIETNPMKEVLYPEMSSDKGGDIPVSYHPETNKPIPSDRLYRVVLESDKGLNIKSIVIGSARIQTKPQSLISKVYKRVVSIIIQESGL